MPESIPGWNVLAGAGDSEMGLGSLGGDVMEPPDPLMEPALPDDEELELLEDEPELPEEEEPVLPEEKPEPGRVA